MKLFSWLYHKMLKWSAHRHAHYYLAGVSFAESAFFPIPPDIMLISMGLAAPHRSWRFALIATLCSVSGGLFGYVIGVYAMEFIRPYILASAYAPYYKIAVQWFEKGDLWVVILAGFTPFPYKIFTITAGAMKMPLLPFIGGSLLGRGLRFYLVSGLMYFTGARLEAQLRRWIDLLGWIFLGGLCVGYGLYRLCT